MNEVVFKTKAEADTQQSLDFTEYIKHHSDNPDYVAQTTRWATPKERLDGKWAYPCCPEQDYTGMTVEEYDVNNYPTEEE